MVLHLFQQRFTENIMDNTNIASLNSSVVIEVETALVSSFPLKSVAVNTSADTERMAREAMKRLADWIARSSGQHLRQWRKHWGMK